MGPTSKRLESLHMAVIDQNKVRWRDIDWGIKDSPCKEKKELTFVKHIVCSRPSMYSMSFKFHSLLVR